MNWTKGILDLLYPPKCILCSKLLQEGETDLCDTCSKSLPMYQGEGAHGEFFHICVAPFHYEGKLRKSILRYKFIGYSQYAAAYGKMLAACLCEKKLTDFDLLSWVPVSARRRRKRGYDQTKLLAQAVAKELQVTLTPTLLKIIHNPAQSKQQDYSKRRANVQGVYKPVEPERFRGKRILLIDDICTSGATLSESSRVLLTAGAEQVTCAVLAIAE